MSIESAPAEIIGELFSRDRAMQLDATLRSLQIHCTDLDRLRLTVVYACSSSLDAAQYGLLADEYGSDRIRFLRQSNFRSDTLISLTSKADGGSPKIYRILLRLGRRGSRLRRRFLPGVTDHFWLFLVDDSLFVRDFSLETILQALSAEPRALGFSLRLGRNTGYCYPLDRPQQLPAFSEFKGGILAYDWTEADLDFGYPLEVSSSMYRASDLLPILEGLRFGSPNHLEGELAAIRGRFHHKPQLLCFEQSAAFSLPVNKVNRSGSNRAGCRPDYSDRALADLFSAGRRIDVEMYSGFTPNACHQEVELFFR